MYFEAYKIFFDSTIHFVVKSLGAFVISRSCLLSTDEILQNA